ncbi:unnamed protein product [Rangifer tarandus platyrhynchus]|uniref:Uncharacterized protein n=1 Tax=Rangifer tarandus platyrhynchus TaxID=3082113 RepID=A0ABN8XRK2_RANTA|nr:unnamed protein product [Rangifer tarandus platyrhynchus]
MDEETDGQGSKVPALIRNLGADLPVKNHVTLLCLHGTGVKMGVSGLQEYHKDQKSLPPSEDPTLGLSIPGQAVRPSGQTLCSQTAIYLMVLSLLLFLLEKLF